MISIKLYCYTIYYLKPVQIGFQFLYRFWKPSFLDVSAPFDIQDILWESGLKHSKPTLAVHVQEGRYNFRFLNKSKIFSGAVDWNHPDFGKLWTYHLNYFEFLQDENISTETCLNLIRQYQAARFTLNDGLEPYPISLRGMNWIQYFSRHRIHSFDDFLFSQYCLLNRRLEYHLLGNHLLENGFSLLFAAFYFQQKKWYHRSTILLRRQLREQLLDDGGHFERSPMYHSIILDRLLDGIRLMRLNPGIFPDQTSTTQWLKDHAGMMLGWLEQMELTPGELPDVNDSSVSMCPHIPALKHYAGELQIKSNQKPLSESGYRRISRAKYTALVDVGPIGPDYIPGHAHADTFNTLLWIGGEPILVEAGTSTYENNIIRTYERSTHAHNTVTYDFQNSSDVWGAFRVGARARVQVVKDTGDEIIATHNGFKKFGITHRRSWSFAEDSIRIQDEMVGKSRSDSKAWFNFPEHLQPELDGNRVRVSAVSLVFSGDSLAKVELVTYERAIAFNQRVSAVAVCVTFRETLQTQILIEP